MLPSSGYFKVISCPFYDSGLCERPYCHFRHVKRDSSVTQNHDIQSGTVLQKLVTSALQKVLQQTEALTGSPIQSSTSPACDSSISSSISVYKATYNPTPISELNKIKITEAQAEETPKRHIPVPYTPRKPTNTLLKRSVDSNDSVEIEPLTFVPPPLKFSQNCSEKQDLETYLLQESEVSTELNSSNIENELQKLTFHQVEVEPSDHQYAYATKNVSVKKLLEYSPTEVTKSRKSSSIKYRPTPRSEVPCFSSDEEEPETKKVKLSTNFNELDDLGPEFDILGQILDEEKMDQESILKPHPDNAIKLRNGHDSNIKLNKDAKNERNHTLGDTLSKADKTLNENSTTSKNDTDDGTKTTTSVSNEKSEAKHDISQSCIIEKSLIETKDKSGAKHDKKYHKSSRRDKNEERKPEAGQSSKTGNTKHSGRENKTDISKNSDKHPKNETCKSSKHSISNSEIDSKSPLRHKSNSKQDKISSKERDRKRSKSSSTHKSSQSRHDNKHKIKNYKEKRQEKCQENKNNEIGPEEIANLSICSGDNNAVEALVNVESVSSESDEETRAMECKRIFEEYIPTMVIVASSMQDTENTIDDELAAQYVPGKVRISRTVDKNVKMQPKPHVKPDYKVNAAQAMTERLAKVKEYHTSRSMQSPDTRYLSGKSDSSKSSISSSSKVRIAHVPYASTLVHAKKGIPPTTSFNKNSPSTSSTIVQTNKKGTHRTAHIPNEKFIDRPGVLEPLASKIPANIRSIYLNMMIDECLKIYIQPTDAYNRAQHEELHTSKKCSKVHVYKNSAVLTVTRLRKELQECNGIKKSGSDCSTLQGIPHGASGKTGNTGSWSIECKNQAANDVSKELTGAKFYKNITQWVLTEQQLKENGFPMAHPSLKKGRAIIYGENKSKPPNGFIRTCCRCKKEYTVDKKGFQAVKKECVYHPNKKYKVRGEAKYQCCGQDGMSDGCCVAPAHVFEYVDYKNLKGFITTMPPDREMDDYGVYSLDCEMCYTTNGLDLTRITVINSDCKVAYESLIRPIHPIIDYNTRFSGITEEQMVGVKTTLIEVQATLLSMFNSKTVLVGHSLESDLKVLKLIHSTVIDTSVLFPHKMGPPFKRALRNLCSENLNKIIQNSVDGHDSAEDATVCMELVFYKLKEYLKTR